jgi:hypothetical protein
MIGNVNDDALEAMLPPPVEQRRLDQQCGLIVPQTLPWARWHKLRQHHDGQLPIVGQGIGFVQKLQQRSDDGAIGRRHEYQRHTGPPLAPSLLDFAGAARLKLDVERRDVVRRRTGEVDDPKQTHRNGHHGARLTESAQVEQCDHTQESQRCRHPLGPTHWEGRGDSFDPSRQAYCGRQHVFYAQSSRGNCASEIAQILARHNIGAAARRIGVNGLEVLQRH